MATITTIQTTDLITNSRADINTNFANLNSDKIETSVLDTDNTLAADSDAKIPSQKAIKTYVDAQGNNLAPTGAVTAFAGSSAPTGWLLADGTAVSRATYATLFGIISTTYGAGNGTTTFNVPNLKGKIPVGLNSVETEFDALAETGGAKTHTLAATEIPEHTHPIAAIGTVDADYFSAGSGVTIGSALTATGVNANAGGAHNNLQPYLVLNYIIKT